MTAEPEWLTLDDIFFLHRLTIRQDGGADGVRDRGLIEATIARPQPLFAHGEEPTIFTLAAAYAFALVRNHSFVDGNKRVGFYAMGVFLDIDGYVFDATEQESYDRMIGLAEGSLCEADFAVWLASKCYPAED